MTSLLYRQVLTLADKKKIAILITRMDLGGAQEVALETAAGLDPARFEAFLLAGPGGMLDAAASARLGARYVAVPPLVHPISPLADLKALLWLVRYFYRERPDVVHTHSSKAGLVGRLAAWIAGVPAVVHTVHGWSFHDRMKYPLRGGMVRLERRLAALTDTLCVVAESCRDKGLFNDIGEAWQYRLLRAGVDLEAWRALKPLAHEGVVVGCIANCKDQKNPLDFVRVAALALENAPSARFVYVGDGPLRAGAEALAAELGVADKVNFLGWAADPRALAAGFDVFLLTSLWEGLPCVFPQALSLGLPVVATNVDGAPEIILEGENGYLCQPGDIPALAGRVAALVNDAELRARLGAHARGSVGEAFGFADMVAQSAALYGGF
jgi:glycosyltransferase involved in cell wall biosynthesis